MNVSNRKCVRTLARRSLRASRTRNLIAVLAIALTTVLFTSLFTIALSINDGFQQNNFRQVGGYSHGGFKYLTEAQYEALKDDPLIGQAGLRRFVGMPTQDPFNKAHVEVSYADANDAHWMYCDPAEGRLPQEGTDEAATDTHVLELLGVEPELGARFTLTFDVDGHETTQTFTLSGWWEYDEAIVANHVLLPESRVDALLDEYPNVLYIKSDPTPEDETPVKLKNNRFARIFEMVGDMYARPKYGTIDLTPFFAPFYMLFFGICLNDAGYGLILLAMGMAMLWKFKGGMMRRAAWFATMCAVSTIVFGLFCGSFFGVSLKAYFPSIPFFDFQGRFFSWALAIGLVQILFGQVLRIVMVSVTAGFRYALSTLGWFLVILAGSLAAGLPLLDPAWVIPGFTTSSPAFYGVAAIGVVLMLFFNSPGKNPFVNFGTGLWDTYNNITGILSDVLSYIRLFAIGLSGGILATVFNDLATGLSPDIPVVRELMILLILLVGHGINLFMSSISSFVHPMRLTFVEFYKNAGFEMAARQFEPLTKIDQSENK